MMCDAWVRYFVSAELFEVGTNQGDGFVNGVVDTLVIRIGLDVGDGAVGVAKALQQMPLKHIGHQAVDGATYGG